jgi:hypothetical protein
MQACGRVRRFGRVDNPDTSGPARYDARTTLVVALEHDVVPLLHDGLREASLDRSLDCRRVHRMGHAGECVADAHPPFAHLRRPSTPIRDLDEQNGLGSGGRAGQVERLDRYGRNSVVWESPATLEQNPQLCSGSPPLVDPPRETRPSQRESSDGDRERPPLKCCGSAGLHVNQSACLRLPRRNSRPVRLLGCPHGRRTRLYCG